MLFALELEFVATLDFGDGFPPEKPSPEVPGGVVELIPSIPVPESSGRVVSFKMGEKSIDASLVPTKDLLGVSGAEKLKEMKEMLKIMSCCIDNVFEDPTANRFSRQSLNKLEKCILKFNQPELTSNAHLMGSLHH